MYGRNAIQEVQANEITYIKSYKGDISISLTIYVPFGSVHTCYTFHTAFQVKRRNEVLKEDNDKGSSKKRVLKDDRNKGRSKKRFRLDEESNDESTNHDQFSCAGINRGRSGGPL